MQTKEQQKGEAWERGYLCSVHDPHTLLHRKRPCQPGILVNSHVH